MNAIEVIRIGRSRSRQASTAASNGEARRLIRSGGARVNDAAVSDEGLVIGRADLRDGAIKLSSGRKQHRLVRES